MKGGSLESSCMWIFEFIHSKEQQNNQFFGKGFRWHWKNLFFKYENNTENYLLKESFFFLFDFTSAWMY